MQSTVTVATSGLTLHTRADIQKGTLPSEITVFTGSVTWAACESARITPQLDTSCSLLIYKKKL